MNKRPLAFFAAHRASVFAFLMLAGAVFAFSPMQASAYAVGGGGTSYGSGPVAPTTPATGGPGAIGQGYDFNSSFNTLISSFTTFINNIKATNGTVTLGGPSSGSVGNVGLPAGVTVTVDTQPYVMQFDAWFYNLAGVHVAGLLDLVIHSLLWIFGVLMQIVAWIAAELTKSMGSVGK